FILTDLRRQPFERVDRAYQRCRILSESLGHANIALRDDEHRRRAAMDLLAHEGAQGIQRALLAALMKMKVVDEQNEVVASGNRRPGPCFLLRVDRSAIDRVEVTDRSFTSADGQLEIV